MTSKEKILKAGEDLLYRQGYTSTSVDDIAALSGVSKSNFYYHFKAKEDLGLAVLDRRADELNVLLHATLCHPELGPVEQLNAFADAVISHHAQLGNTGGCPFGNLVAEMSEHSERMRERLSNLFCGLSSTVCSVVQAGQESGELRPEADPEDYAALFVHAVQGMCLLVKCHRTMERQGAGLRLLIQLMCSSSSSDSVSCSGWNEGTNSVA